jgi:hypothetical protein
MTIKWGIYVFDPNGDYGDGAIIGPYMRGGSADRDAEAIRERADDEFSVECIVVPLVGPRDGVSYALNRLRLDQERRRDESFSN